MNVRTAKITQRHGRPTIQEVCAYMPANYVAELDADGITITGVDDHGWSLDGYVIPRLASGLITAREVTGGEAQA